MTTLYYNCDDRLFTIDFPNHHKAHEWKSGRPPADAITVHPRMLANFRTTAIAGSVLVKVSGFFYQSDGQFVVVPDTTLNLTSYIPDVNEVRLVVVGYDTSLQAHVVVSGPSSFFSAATPPALPTGFSNTFAASALVRIRYNITELSELDITDARSFNGGGGGGGVWPVGSSVTIDTATYPSVDSANAAAEAGQAIRLGTGQFDLEGDVDLVAEASLVGSGMFATVLNVGVNALSTSDFSSVQDIAIITESGGELSFIDTYLIGIDIGGTGDVTVDGGIIVGGVIEGAVTFLNSPLLVGLPRIGGTVTGAFEGYYIDNTGNLVPPIAGKSWTRSFMLMGG